MTDGAGNVVMDQDYMPFGGDLPEVGQTEVLDREADGYKYTGQKEVASIGLYYYGARYYDPKIGRFITEDSWPGEMVNPQSQNLYVYVMNNPLRYIDPTGHFKVDEKNFSEFKITIEKDDTLSKIVSRLFNISSIDTKKGEFSKHFIKAAKEVSKEYIVQIENNSYISLSTDDLNNIVNFISSYNNLEDKDRILAGEKLIIPNIFSIDDLQLNQNKDNFSNITKNEIMDKLKVTTVTGITTYGIKAFFDTIKDIGKYGLAPSGIRTAIKKGEAGVGKHILETGVGSFIPGINPHVETTIGYFLKGAGSIAFQTGFIVFGYTKSAKAPGIEDTFEKTQYSKWGIVFDKNMQKYSYNPNLIELIGDDET